MGGSGGLVMFCLIAAASVTAANATTIVFNYTDHYWGCLIILVEDIIPFYDKMYCRSISLSNILQSQSQIVVKWT